MARATTPRAVKTLAKIKPSTKRPAATSAPPKNSAQYRRPEKDISETKKPPRIPDVHQQVAKLKVPHSKPATRKQINLTPENKRGKGNGEPV